jgi:hypothetical protein
MIHLQMVRTYFGMLAVAIILAPVLIGCEGKSGGSSSVSPFEGEPMIVDSALALDVVDNRPNGITDTFRSDDSRIYLWIYWINVEGSHTVRVEWFSPEEETGAPPYFKKTEYFTSGGGEQITWFYLERPTGGFTRGEWEVYVYLDGSFERSYLFYVE